MPEKSTLMCWRISEVDVPLTQAVVDSCATCDAAVWRSLSSPEVDRVLCIACGYAEFKDEPNANLMRPTGEQLADMKQALE